MSTYRVEFERRAARQLHALQRSDQQRIRAAITLLADEPRPPNCIALEGRPGVYRVRVGVFRILYRVRDKQLLVLVVRIGHRRDVYR